MMYTVASFLHITGAVLLSAATGIEWICVLNLRKAASAESAERSLKNYSLLGALGPIATVLILVPGVYMTLMVWREHMSWIEVSFAGLVVIALVGSLVTGRRLGKVRELLRREQSLTPEVRRLVNGDSLMLSLQIRSGIFLGIILMMVAKTEMTASLVILAASFAVGWIPVWRLARAEPAVQTEHDVMRTTS